ncbi:MAG: aminotransferase class V-fold PLP-dependent enzyme, partial [Clostridia bacterium]|nr:aminotransferase class V-fold PLP-dependent enzyme [Clostridia bacterium]
MLPCLWLLAQPLFPHIRRHLEAQRDLTAKLLHVSPHTITYTSGASESNALVMQSLLWRRSKGRIILGCLEHDSISRFRRILEFHGFEVVIVPARKGIIDPEETAS